MKRRDFCKALVCSAALAPGLALPRAEAAAKSQTVGRAVPAGNYTMSFRSELSQMDIEHEYYYSDSFFAHSSIQYDHQLALATLGMVTAAFNTWASDAKYWANGDVGRENSLDAAYTKLGFGDVKYRYYDVDVGKAGDFVGWSTARKTITLNGKRTTIVALILRGGGYGGEWVSNLHTGTGHAHSGFIIPVHEVFADLKNYLAVAQQKGGLGVVKLWMGGYSRGAAVANLLAARVNKELPGLEWENVFVYTFATPVALGPQDYPNLQQDYDNNHNADGSLKEVDVFGHRYKGRALYDVMEGYVRAAFFGHDAEESRRGRDLLWYLWLGEGSPLFAKSKMATFELYLIADKAARKEVKNPFYTLIEDERVIAGIFEDFGMDPETSHIVCGHVPVKVKDGEDPVKCGGRVFMIDGGFSRAYQPTTGIAGYTLIDNSYEFILAAHEPLKSAAAAVVEELDIHSSRRVVERVEHRTLVADTDDGADIRRRVEDLEQLLEAYRDGQIAEGVR